MPSTSGIPRLLIVSLTCVIAFAVGAKELTLNRCFSDNMVLQRGKPCVIKGQATADARVTVFFIGQKKTAMADKDGNWVVTLDPMKASAEGQNLTVDGGGTVTIRNVVVGDVLILARQSSIDVTLKAKSDGKQAAAAYKPNPMVRAMRIKAKATKDPQHDLGKDATVGWMQVDQKSALSLSATGFHLIQELAQKGDVPLGIIDIDMGAYVAAAWMSPAGLDESLTRFPNQGDLPYFRKTLPARADKWASGELKKNRDDYYNDRMKGKGRKPSLGMPPLEFPYYPSGAYNAVLHPLRGMAAKAMIAQVGNDYPLVTYARLRAMGKITDLAELDRAWPQSYPMIKHANRMVPLTLPLVPTDLRRVFDDKKLPIAMILPPGSDFYDYAVHNREIRELLRMTQVFNPGIGLIMAGTKHIPLSGQPADDRLLAARCKQWVLGAVYGMKTAPSGPVFMRAEVGPAQATVYFEEGTAEGLTANGAALAQFEVSGPDKQFVPCTAKIEGTTIKLTSDKVHYIQFVRYNWSRKPDQGLTNSAGLPAIPFTSRPDWVYNWWPPAPPQVYPPEYSTSAGKWPKSDVAIINGALNDGNSGDSEPNPALIGPTGMITDPFGPNLYVHRAEPGSPADGKVLRGDLVFAVNGREFGDDMYREMANAITHSESEAGKGKLVLGVRRAGKNIEVTLQLKVMGSYSETTPFFCPKSEKIVQQAEQWSARQYRPAIGLGSSPSGKHDTDLWFLMASGKPAYQGLVRRKIYEMMQKPPSTPDPNKNNNSWYIGYTGILFGEYYNATGDRNILPYLQSQAGWAAAVQLRPQGEEGPQEKAYTEQQVGGYRTRYGPNRPMSTGGYGLMSAAGMPCVMTMLYAKEAGLKVDEVALKRGLKHFNFRRAEYGDVIYWYHPLWRDRPPVLNPEAEARGGLWAQNGKLGTAAALFNLAGYPTATNICSRICTYGYNNTRHGHGGMFYNNLWTPIGAHIAGERAYKHFMKGQTWWRELYRRHDGSFNQVGRGHIGVAYALHYVAQNRQLRMLGAPKSAFCAEAPDFLKPALAAHARRDYALAQKLVSKELNERVISAKDMPAVHHLIVSLMTLQKSIAHDLTYVEGLIKAGRFYNAALELPQLKGVVAADNPRLVAILKTLESDRGRQLIADSRKAEEAKAREQAAKAKAGQPVVKPRKEDWVCLMTDIGGTRDRFGQVPADKATRWRMKIIETPENAPKGWTDVGFDDKSWDDTVLPLSWRVSHTALFRGTFVIEDKASLNGLRIRGYLPKQRNIQVFINGKLVAKINNCSNDTTAVLTDYALQVSKSGKNTLAIVTTHAKRWGKVKGEYSGAMGFGFRLDARKK